MFSAASHNQTFIRGTIRAKTEEKVLEICNSEVIFGIPRKGGKRIRLIFPWLINRDAFSNYVLYRFFENLCFYSNFEGVVEVFSNSEKAQPLFLSPPQKKRKLTILNHLPVEQKNHKSVQFFLSITSQFNRLSLLEPSKFYFGWGAF